VSLQESREANRLPRTSREKISAYRRRLGAKSFHPEEQGPVTAMRRLEKRWKEALSNIIRRSCRDLSFASWDHGTREYRGNALFVNDAIERDQYGNDTTSLERAAMPACLPWALVLW